MRRAQFRWEMLVKCGDPAVAAVGAMYSTETTRNGWFGMPDNIAFDSQGRLWIATDGNSKKGDRPRRRTLGGRDRRAAARHVAAFLPRAGRRRNVRPVLHARRRDAVRRRPASGRGRIRGASLDLRGAGHALARLQAGHAAAAVGGRDHQARRRQDRVVKRAPDPLTVSRRCHGTAVVGTAVNSQCRRFEVPTAVAANSTRNFKSKSGTGIIELIVPLCFRSSCENLLRHIHELRKRGTRFLQSLPGGCRAGHTHAGTRL